MMLRGQNYRPRALTFVFALLTSVAGCSDIPGYDSVVNFVTPSDGSEIAKGKSAKEIEPVRYRIGDRYTFDNPIERWEIVEIKGERVYWRNGSGERQVTSFNPLLPPTEWQSRIRGSGRRLIRDVEGDLFPMKVGAVMRYRTTVTTDKPPFGWEHKWSCRVDAKERVETLSGPFEAFVVLCGRALKDEVTYYFAPKIGNYVRSRTKLIDGKPDSVRNLLSFERADGTVVAGIVQNPKIAAAKLKSNATQPPPLKVVPPSKKLEETRVDLRSASNAQESEQDILASVVLATPSFGGRAVPMRHRRPVGDKLVRSANRDLTEPPMPEPAPLAKVSRAVSPPPVTRPVPKPVRTKRAVPNLSRKALGPRATARAIPNVPRSRVPVPPPPTVKLTVPPVPKPAAAAKRSSPSPRVSIPPPQAPKPVQRPTPRRSLSVPPPPALAATTMTVHLASFRSEAAARQGWTALESANGDLLKGLKPEIRKVAVEGKGTFFRLHAMPVPLSGVGDLCRKLNSRGVFCTPAG